LNLAILYATLLTLFAPQEDSLHIGLLIPDPHAGQVVEAAQKAIDQANHSRSFGDRPFKLTVRSTEGFWGAGSKESVSLVYEDQARVIVGSLDGRNAHLTEQVAAKSHLVYLETKATDPTLSQAYVPWFFRIVPNDDQQARAILDRIQSQGGESVAIWSQDEYDTSYAVKSFARLAKTEYGSSPLILHADADDLQSTSIINKLKRSHTTHLVIPYYSSSVLELATRIRKEIPQIQFYGTLAFCGGLKESDLAREALQGTLLVHSYTSPNRLKQKTDLYAMYAYDGMLLIIKAIQEIGSDRTKIQKHLVSMKYAEGISGPIQFDAMGNRKGPIRFAKIEKGRLIAAD
jgi:ABC-type branched-subunit amino acid transport system substrate-binding protein